MSAHVEDRLSAYLDAELAPDEREAVAGHLEGCAACRAVLEELRSLDQLSRGSVTLPPEGYFEALPGRVRARLEGQRRRPWRPPAWSWAAAAALLLGVLTPITLRELPELEQAVGKQSSAPARPAEEHTAPRAAEDRAEALQDAAAKKAESAPAAALKVLPPATQPPARQAARPPSAAAPPPPAATPSEAHVARTDEAPRRTPLPRAESLRAEPPRPAGFAAGPARGPRAAAAATGATREGVPLTASEARAERERLHALLEDRPQNPALENDADVDARVSRASDRDALEVRIIELSLRAWQLERRPEDHEQLEKDARAYLARSDAARPDYVRSLLEQASGS